MKSNVLLAVMLSIMVLAVFSTSSLSNEADLNLNITFNQTPSGTVELDSSKILTIELMNIETLFNETQINTSEELFCSFWNISSDESASYSCKGNGDCCTYYETANITPNGEYESGSAISRILNLTGLNLIELNISVMLAYLSEEHAGISEWSDVLTIQNLTENISSDSNSSNQTNVTLPVITIISPQNDSEIVGNLNYIFNVEHNALTECSVFLNGNVYALHTAESLNSNVSGTIMNEILTQQNSLRIVCKESESIASEETAIFSKRNATVSIEQGGESLGSNIKFTLANPSDKLDVSITYPPVPGFPNSVSFSMGYNTSNPAVIYLFQDTNRAGNYTISYNLSSENSLVLQDSKLITIENSLNCQLLSENEYFRGTNAEITMRASEGTEPYTLSFNNQNKTGSQNDFTVQVQGNDNMILEGICYDFYNNKKIVSKQINLMENVTFFVKDSSNNSDVTATISFYDTQILGSRASFIVSKGTYSYSISAPGYSQSIGEVNVDSSKNLTIQLVRDNFAALTITAPLNNSDLIFNSTEENYIFRFLISSQENMSCSLGVSNDNSWYTNLDTISSFSSTQIAYNIPKNNLSAVINSDVFKVQVTCRKGNLIKKSDAFNITLVPTEQSNETNEVQFEALSAIGEEQQDIVLAELVDRVAQSNILIESFEPKLQSFLSAIGETQKMNDAEREVRNARRDLYNLVYRQLSEDENTEEIERLTKILSDVESEILVGARILFSTESVSYPSSEDISKMSERYSALPSTHSLSTRILDSRKFSSNLEKLQKELSVTTSILQGEIEYENRNETYTVIIKSYNLKNASKEMLIIDDVSTLPISNLQANNVYNEALTFDEEKGMVFLKNPSDQGTYSYFSIGTPTISDKDAVLSYVIDRKSLSERSPSATGFVTAIGGQSLNFKSAGAMIILIVIIGVVYGFYSGRITVALPIEISGQPRANARMLRESLTQIEHHKRSCEFEKAFLAYEESSMIYRQLSQKQIDIFHPEMTLTYASLCSKDALRVSEKLSKCINNFKIIEPEEFMLEIQTSRWAPKKVSYNVKEMSKSFKENVDLMKRTYSEIGKLASYKNTLSDIKGQISELKNTAQAGYIREMALNTYDATQEAISKIDVSSQSYKSAYDSLKLQYQTIRKIAKEQRGRR